MSLKKIKVIIAGSRTFNDYSLLKNECDSILTEILNLNDEVEIVSGAAKGADELGERYAMERGFQLQKFPANWNDVRGKPVKEVKSTGYGRKYWTRAGIERNIEMANYADMLIAFWDGQSTGTAHMINIAGRKGLVIRKCLFREIKQDKLNLKMNFINDWSKLRPLKTESRKLKQVEWLKFYNEECPKDQIVIHHSCSGPGISGDLSHLGKFKSHIAVCVFIERDGTIRQLFSSKYWGYHLKCGNTQLDKHSIAVELDSWGQLTEEDGEYRNIYGSKVDVPIQVYPQGFRGEQIFESYTLEQLRSLGELILLWNQMYGIPLDYNEDMWDISERAMAGVPGIYGHISYRASGKWDPHPDEKLIDMLKTLPNLT